MIKENRFSSENVIFSFGGLALNKKDRDKVKLREVVHRQLRYWDFELVSGDLYLSKTGPWWLRPQASTGEGSYKRSHERCLSPVVQMSTLVQQIVKCISLHKILSWSELSQIPKKWDLWVILWYFSVFPYFHVLKVDGDANYQILLLGQSLPWKIMVHTITSKTHSVLRGSFVKSSSWNAILIRHKMWITIQNWSHSVAATPIWSKLVCTQHPCLLSWDPLWPTLMPKDVILSLSLHAFKMSLLQI